MGRDDDIRRLLGDGPHDTGETLGFDMSCAFIAQVVRTMHERGVTTGMLAERLGTTVPAVEAMLTPKSTLTMKAAARLALALGTTAIPPRLQGTGGQPHERM